MLSRRHFLQLAGIALASPLVNIPLPDAPQPAPLANAAPTFETTYGRALGSIPVYAAPDMDAPLLHRLWSDTVVPIQDTQSGWYRLASGYTSREGLQPMIAPAHGSPVVTPPFWGTVSGAIAVVREYCAVNAPIITRVGHGGVLRVIDRLHGAGIDWYGVADDEDSPLLGWVIASVVAPVSIDNASPTLTLAIDTAARRLDAYDGDHHLLSAPVTISRDLIPGVYPVVERAMSLPPNETNRSTLWIDYDIAPTTHYGVPYALTFGSGLHFAGAYWHNWFGSTISTIRTFGPAVEVTPALAQWLYPRAAEIIIS